MAALKTEKKRWISASLAAGVLLLAAHTASSQIRIGGITIAKPNRANPEKTEKTQPPAEKTSQPSDARTEPAARSETTTTAAVQQDPPAMLNYFLHEIAEAKSDVDIYDPAERQYLVKAVQEEWVLRAVSPRARGTCDKRPLRRMAASQS